MKETYKLGNRNLIIHTYFISLKSVNIQNVHTYLLLFSLSTYLRVTPLKSITLTIIILIMIIIIIIIKNGELQLIRLKIYKRI